MREKINKLLSGIHTPLFIGFIFFMMAMTYTGLVKKTVEDTKFTFESYVNLSKKFESILQKNIFGKYSFINLNGLVARTLGINSLNNVQKLGNGYLSNFGNKVDVNPIAQNLIDLNKFLKARNIEFIYVLAPSKPSFYDVQFAPGYTNDAQENIGGMVKALQHEDFNMLDMNAWFKNNGWTMENTFFKTDNHWLPQASLAAARCTMELLERKGLAVYGKELLKDENYDITLLKAANLGAWGRRTGLYYGGLDDILIYQPKFKTNYMYAALNSSSEWIYRDNILDMSRIHDKSNKNYFENGLYSVYMYGDDYQLRDTVNKKGENDKRILITGDSFRLPFEYFLITQFKDIHDIDLRRYIGGEFVQYVEEIKPDIVIMCTDEGELSGKRIYTFGVKEYLAALTEPLGSIQEIGDVEMQAEEKNNNKFEVVCSNLEPRQMYTLTLDGTELSGAENCFVQMTLQNLSANKPVYNRFFYANSGDKQKWIFTTPEKVDETYDIWLYAGVKGHTAKIGVKAKGIKLQKGISED